MTPARRVLAATLAITAGGLSGCATAGAQSATPAPAAAVVASLEAVATSVQTDLDRIFADATLDRSVLAVHVESLASGRTIYSRNAGTRVVPASVLKLVTAAVAGDRLGWDHRFETRLDATGPVVDGRLSGDLIVTGSGDPTITARDLIAAPLFDEWADALRAAGITQIDGRVVGDDNSFDDEPLGAGWAWDYLSAAYAAPSGALSYNENLVVIRVTPGPSPGTAAQVTIGPPGHGLATVNQVSTAAAGTAVSVFIERMPGSNNVTVRGQVPAGGDDVLRATTIENPTMFFVEALRAGLARRGIAVTGGAYDIDALPMAASPEVRRVVARHLSPPLSSIVAQMMKTSQNFYGEMLIKAIGRNAATGDAPGSTERGRQAVRQTLETWRIPADALVMYDGSGLSRYDYVSAELLVRVLDRMWQDEQHRGPFAAALPVAGHDGTLSARMTETLRRRVQAKTGTLNHVRSLAGYAETASGEKIAFVMIANHFVAPNAQVDAVMERALERLTSDTTGTTGEP